MKILVCGAGVIGNLYGVYMSKSGCDVSLLARGKRLMKQAVQCCRYKLSRM